MIVAGKAYMVHWRNWQGRAGAHDGDRDGMAVNAALLPTAATYLGAAVAEIAGCFAFWAWLRLDRSGLWIIPGIAALILFAYLLSRIDSGFAGRAYAAYGGVYIAASLAWMWMVEAQRPDRWDLIGAVICLGGAAVILFGPRGT